MAYTYTFPTQVTPAGILEFKVKLLQGSGSATPTDKYFSSSFRWVDQTDLRGGEIASPTAEFIIDDDVNNLFTDTIFPTLENYSVFSGDNSVVVSVTLNSIVRFIGVIATKTINVEYYYASNDTLDNKRTKITFSCIWIFDFLKAITASSLATTLKSATYSETFVYGPITYYWTSLSNIMRACCDILVTNFGLTVNLSTKTIDYTFYTNSFRSDEDFPSGLGGTGYYSFNIFSTSNSQSDDSLSIESIGIIIGSNYAVSGYEFIGYMDSEESNYAQTAYDLFIGVLNSLSLTAKFAYRSTTQIDITITSRLEGSEKTLPSVIDAYDEPFSILAWRGVDITSKVTGNAVNTTFENTIGSEIFKKELLFDFKNDIEMPGCVLGNDPVKTIFSLTSPPINGTLRLIRDCGTGINQLSNASFDLDLDGWTQVGVNGVWAIGTEGRNNNPGVLKLSSINNSFDHAIKHAITPSSNKIIGSYWVRILPLLPGSSDLVVRLTVDFYTGTERFSGYTHTIRGTSAIMSDWNLILSNYDYRYKSSFSSKRADGSTRYTPGVNGRRGGRDRIKPVVYDSFAIRVTPVVFAPGCAEMYFDDCKILDGYINTPDIVSSMIEKNFVSDNLTSLRNIKVDGIVDNLKTSDFATYKKKKYYFQRLTYDVGENETEIEAINYSS